MSWGAVSLLLVVAAGCGVVVLWPWLSVCARVCWSWARLVVLVGFGWARDGGRSVLLLGLWSGWCCVEGDGAVVCVLVVQCSINFGQTSEWYFVELSR